MRGVRWVIRLLLLMALVALAGWLSLSPGDRALLRGSPMAFEHDGVERHYRMIPAKPEKPARLVLVLHGLGGSGKRIAWFSGMHNLGGPGTLVVYPDARAVLPDDRATKPGWNAGFCCGTGLVNRHPDLGFLLALTRELSTRYALPPEAVFVCGFSNGGFMTQHLLAEHPELFGGGAAVASSLGTEDHHHQPNEAIPIFLINGARDPIIPLAGGPGENDPEFVWLPFQETSRRWQEVNAVTGLDERQDPRGRKAIGEGKAAYRHWILDELGHAWPGWRTWKPWEKRPEGSRVIHDFFETLALRPDQG